MEFCAAVGSKHPLQNMKTFFNNIFSLDPGSESASSSLLMKINGCLKRCSERPKLVIPPKMIVEDIEYFQNTRFTANFWE